MSLQKRTSIRELQLEDKEEVQLYLELIRVIERDIDDIKTGDTQNGWTSWALLGATAAAVLLLLEETRKLQSIPGQDAAVILLAALLLYNIVKLLANFLNSASSPEVRPGRVKWSRDIFFPLLPVTFYRMLIFLAAAAVAYSLQIRSGPKTLVIATFAYWSLWAVMPPIYSIINYPLGNRKEFKKFAYIGIATLLILSLTTFVLLLTHLQPPLGEAATLPFILAGLSTTIIILMENFISTLGPSRLLANLLDLRNDIVFLRVDIDEALQRYEVLQEGETLPIALKQELNEIINTANIIEYAYSNMATLLGRINENLPYLRQTPDHKQDQRKQLLLDLDSYSLHRTKCQDIDSSLNKSIKKFTKKLTLVSGATGDWLGENTIRSFLTQKFQQLSNVRADLDNRFLSVQNYLNNPQETTEQLPRPQNPESEV